MHCTTLTLSSVRLGSDDYEPDQGNERDLEEEESNYEYEDNNPHEDANDEALDEESENEDEKSKCFPFTV